MGSYLLVFLVAALMAALATPLWMRIGVRLGAVDRSREPPVPRAGGGAIAVGAVIALVVVGLLNRPTGLTLVGRGDVLAALAVGGAAMFVLGAVDDVRDLSARTKFFWQVVIAGVVYWLDVRITLISVPFGALELGPVFSVLGTIVWVVGISNAFNLLDGADGVAVGSAFFAGAAVVLVSLAFGHAAIGLVAAALTGAALGFLPFNFPPARAFLGDAGSLLMGFVLAVLAVEGSTKGATVVAIAVPLVAFGVPVFDTTITLIRRLVRGRPIFERDLEHVHHHLQRAGLSPRKVAGLVYLASAAFALAAMAFVNPGARSYAVAMVVLGAGVWVVARHLRLHELNELARVARRGVLKPKMIQVNVQLRRAVEHLDAARSLDDLRDALATLFANAEFDGVQFTAGAQGERRGHTLSWHLQGGRFVEGAAPRRLDEWELVCPFTGGAWEGALHLRRRLARPAPLLDVTLLLELVQPALCNAAGRVEVPATIVA